MINLQGYRADVLTGPVMLRQALREYREVAKLEGTLADQIKVCPHVFGGFVRLC